MRRSALFLVIFVAIAAAFGLSSCSQGAGGLPGQDAPIVDIGNPEDDALDTTSTYTNKAFGMIIEYPAGWTVSGGEDDDHVAFSSQNGEMVDATFVLTPLSKEEFIAANRIDPQIALTSGVSESGFTEILTGVRRDGIGLILEQYATLPIEGGNLIVVIVGHLAADSPWMVIANISCDPTFPHGALSADAMISQSLKDVETVSPHSIFQDHLPNDVHDLPGVPH